MGVGVPIFPGQGDVGCVTSLPTPIGALIEPEDGTRRLTALAGGSKAKYPGSGYWSDLWLAKNTYGTANAITALIQTGDQDCEEVRRGAQWLESVQNRDGGWGEDMFGNRTESTVEQTAWSAEALLLVNPQSESGWKGIKFLIDRQNVDGSWDASCVGIYWEVIGGYADPINASVFPLRALNQAKYAMRHTGNPDHFDESNETA